MKKLFVYILLFLIICSPKIHAQEALTGLQVNQRIKNLHINKSTTKAKQAKAVIELPFFDDFAKSIGFPDTSLWEDNYVFINQNYPYFPISIGVATFDAIDETGSIYPNASSYAFSADTLTSKAINLDYPGDNTIFLSFYYQPGGLGDTPETKDTLLLEFCYNDTVWDKKWHVTFNESDSLLLEKHYYGDTSNVVIEAYPFVVDKDTLTDLKLGFQRVFIPVDEGKYLNNNFKFRFRNYASLSTSTSTESKAGNADHWHVDYILLDKNRTFEDTIFNDYTFCKPLESFLENYESIPWPHYERAQSYERQDSMFIYLRNLYSSAIEIPKQMTSNNLLGFSNPESYDFGGIEPISYMQIRSQWRVMDDFNFMITQEDSALYEIKTFFSREGEDLNKKWNDTTRFLQKFYNYYAYDDGTAENGYGIIGEGAERAMVAMRFRSYKEDTIRGIQIYFNQVLNNLTELLPFKLHIWKDDNGKPGDIIYTLENKKPVYEDELNKFTTYKLDTAIVLNGYFFIGWQKESTSEMLNVGFDVNRINNDKLYYNFSGNWIQSQFEGTVMIRPLFGKEINLVTGNINNPSQESLSFNFYPNPASTIINIDINGDITNEYRYTIFDIYGRIYFDQTIDQTSIDISSLNPGIFFIRITNSKGTSSTQKFIKVH